MEINKNLKKLLVITILLGTLFACSSRKQMRNKSKEKSKKMMTPRAQYVIIN